MSLTIHLKESYINIKLMQIGLFDLGFRLAEWQHLIDGASPSIFFVLFSFTKFNVGSINMTGGLTSTGSIISWNKHIYCATFLTTRYNIKPNSAGLQLLKICPKFNICYIFLSVNLYIWFFLATLVCATIRNLQLFWP